MGRAFGRVIRYRRADALDALRKSFPAASEEHHRMVLREMYEHFGINLVESLRMRSEPEDTLRSSIVWDGLEILQRERERGRGVLVLTAHTGNWEMVCAATPLFGLPLTIVAKPIHGRVLREHVHAVRTRFGLQVLPSRGAYRECLRVLKRNELLGFVLDQNMTRMEGVFVEFFGRPACTTPGLAHLSARAQVRVVPVFMSRMAEGRHRICVGTPMEPPADTEPGTLLAATQTYTRRIEDFIRNHPAQWIWIHRRWKTQPPA